MKWHIYRRFPDESNNDESMHIKRQRNLYIYYDRSVCSRTRENETLV